MRPKGRGRTDARARRKEARRGRGGAGRSRPNEFDRRTARPSEEGEGVPHGAAWSSPLTPSGFRAASRCLRQAFDNAALCGVGEVLGRRASRQVSTACGASNKGLFSFDISKKDRSMPLQEALAPFFLRLCRGCETASKWILGNVRR